MKERFETFTVLITNLNRSIHKIKAMKMAGFDLKSSHVSCLYYLRKKGTLTAKQLCDLCAEDKANISRAVKHLEANGYLTCDSGEKKRYQSPLMLTEKGASVGKQIEDIIDCVLDMAGDGVTPEDRAIMYQSLVRIDKNLQKICEQYGKEAEKPNNQKE